MCCWFLDRTASQAHPRSRGEHDLFSPPQRVALGSSPLARGTFLQACEKERERRLIPARAGNIPWVCGLSGCLPAHPRSRGEHMFRVCGRVGNLGSSPLARGTCGRLSRLPWRRRLIPARAGNIRRNFFGIPLVAAHPRSRGEHRKTEPITSIVPGSSPLARGTFVGQGA